MSVLVVKVGSSSVTTSDGSANEALLASLGHQIAELRGRGVEVVVVTSGAVALGWATIGDGAARPRETVVLQAAAAVGQHRVVAAWQRALEPHGLHAGQVLLGSLDFGHRQQYLHARRTLRQLLDLGVVPVVNENDTTSDEEIRYGDNDRLAALVAQLVDASDLVLLTDTAGLFTKDPRLAEDASLIEVVTTVDAELLAGASGSRSGVGSGGMASKVAAAQIATAAGVQVVIAEAERPAVLLDAAAGTAVGTTFVRRARSLSARRLWIAFALTPLGTVTVDAGAAHALAALGRSLLAAGVVSVEGDFSAGDPVSIEGPDGLLGRGLVALDAAELRTAMGRRSEQRDGSGPATVVHRDDLAVLTDARFDAGRLGE